MRTRALVTLAAAVPLLALPVLASGTALAASHSGSTMLRANLQPVPTNMVRGSGSANVTVTGNTLKVTINATGLDKTTAMGLPAHAQHIHIGGANTCPTASMATQHNGHTAISVKDGTPAYGGIQVSLTTTGDTSPNSALTLKRFPQTPNGTESYSRSIQVSDQVAQDIKAGKGVIVIHGIDYLHNNIYTDLGKSEIDPSKPQEGTAPALCGVLTAMPSGGAATGDGSTAGLQNEGLLALGGGLIAAAAGVLVVRRRGASER